MRMMPGVIGVIFCGCTSVRNAMVVRALSMEIV